MSVQAGVWNLDAEPVNAEFLAWISQSVAQYGLDGEATIINGSVGMLYRPFHTTAESRLECQPHTSACGNVITWDGRLDNREDLLQQLSHVLKDDSTDVAVVAAAFDRWGPDTFAKLIGDWGLSIWNSRERELILARDYIGVRHLFYYPKPKRIIWCNYLAPLALCGDQFTLCDEYIAGFLAADPDAHLTPYCEIHAVPPGKFVRIHGDKISIHTYWAFNTQLRTRYKTNAEYEEHYRYVFRQSVRRRLRTDSPILAGLSGGFDSSSIVCMADDIRVREGMVIPSVETFSYHDSNEPEHDDLPYFIRVEEKRGKTGFHVDLQGSGASISFDYPVFIATPPGLGSRAEVKAALSDIIRQHKYRVMLSGRGGDDVNGQALHPRIQMADLFLQLKFVEMAKLLTDWSLLIRKRPWIHLFFQTLRELMPVSVRARFTNHAEVEAWINRAFARRHRMSARQTEAVQGLWGVRPSARHAVQIIATLSRRMTHTGPNVIEMRYPYLDQNLVEFLTSVPLDQLLRPGQRRFLMRRSLADLLPPEVLNRKTKAGNDRCFSVAFENHWDKVESVFSSPISTHLGYIEKERIHQALISLRHGLAPKGILRLLNALSLELWLRNVAARGVIPPPSPVRTSADTSLVESRAEFGFGRANRD